jgi:hypothetical protein
MANASHLQMLDEEGDGEGEVARKGLCWTWPGRGTVRECVGMRGEGQQRPRFSRLW